MNIPEISKTMVAETFRGTPHDFIEVISHELCTPLNSVIGMADQLAASELSIEQQECLDRLRMSSHAMRKLVGGVLNYVHITSDRFSSVLTDIDVREMLGQVCDLYLPEANAKGLELFLDIAESVPGSVRADRSSLWQIFANLVENAVKFTEQGSVSVVVNADRLEGPQSRSRMRIEVRDTGIGIAPDQLHRVFEPFTQEDESWSRVREGIGLGLASARRLAHLMNGELSVKDSTRAGSVFSFECDFDHVVETSRSHPRWSVKPAATLERVLVVDDHRINRLITRRILSQIGIEADEAESGTQCLEMHKKSAYELIFMDIQMPKMDGVQATRIIRQVERERGGDKKVQIVALTAHAPHGLDRPLLDAGMDGCLSKPLKLEDLRCLLGSA